MPLKVYPSPLLHPVDERRVFQLLLKSTTATAEAESTLCAPAAYVFDPAFHIIIYRELLQLREIPHCTDTLL